MSEGPNWMNVDQRTRFFRSFEKRGSDQCWIWQKARINGFGYGTIRYDGRGQSAHRVSWIIHNGPIPRGLCVLHRCDNPPCVNPAHLFLGSQADNMRDMAAKGRASHRTGRRGEGHPNSKLTDGQVLVLRQLYMDTSLSQQDVSGIYGITKAQVRNIVTGNSWGSVPMVHGCQLAKRRGGLAVKHRKAKHE